MKVSRELENPAQGQLFYSNGTPGLMLTDTLQLAIYNLIQTTGKSNFSFVLFGGISKRL